MAQQALIESPNLQAVESAGVPDLISRLRDQGIARGRTLADEIVAAAQQQAAEIVAAAKRDAETIRARAGEDAGKLKAAGEDAVRLAMRNTVLSLEGGLVDVFQNRVRHLVKGTMEDPTFLQRIILEIAGKAPLPRAGEAVEMLLPADLISLEDLQRKPEEVTPGTLTHFVLSAGEGMLREGVTFGVTDDKSAGVRVKLAGEDMQVDLTEATLSSLLLRHMIPRFRALLRGAVVATAGSAKVPTQH